jgi:hypothetical protein
MTATAQSNRRPNCGNASSTQKGHLGSLSDARDIIFGRLPAEMRLAHEAIGTWRAIASFSRELNESQYAHQFGLIQHHALSASVLSLSNLFEREKGYPNLSIPTAVRILKEHTTEIRIPRLSVITVEGFIKENIDTSFESTDETRLKMPSLIIAYFDRQCPRVSPKPPPPRLDYPLDKTLDDIRVLRNKRYAHFQRCDSEDVAKAPFDGALDLLAFAQNFVDFCGYKLLGTQGPKPTTTAEAFAPNKSKAWHQMTGIIKCCVGERRAETHRAETHVAKSED